MDTLFISLICVVPFIFYLFLGYCSKRFMSLKQDTYWDLNTIAFRFLIPVSLFLNVYQSDFQNLTLSKPILFGIIGIIVLFLLSFLAYRNRKIPDRDRSVMMQAAFRSNYILLGIPLAQNIMGGHISGLSGIMVAIVIPIYNILAVIVLSIYDTGISSKQIIESYKDLDRTKYPDSEATEFTLSRKVSQPDSPSVHVNSRSFLDVLMRILKNPLNIASLVGLVFQLLQIPLPTVIIDILKPLAVMATPLALFALGGRFTFKVEKENRGLLIESVLTRLVLVPTAAVIAAIAIGIRGEALALLLTLFGAPVAVTSYTMAQQMNANEKLAGQILVYSTIFANLTLFLFILILKSGAYF